MDKIDLDQRDRKNLYMPDAQNVVALTTASDEIDDSGIADALVDAVDEMRRTGQRFAYVVIRIER